MKKKRIAIAKKQSLEKMPNESQRQGIWGIFVSPKKNLESRYQCRHFPIFQYPYFVILFFFCNIIRIIFLVDINQLKLEVTGFEELSKQLFLEAHECHNMMDRIEWSKTWKGKYFNFLGYFFSLYCMWKIFIVSSYRIIHRFVQYFFLFIYISSVLFIDLIYKFFISIYLFMILIFIFKCIFDIFCYFSVHHKYCIRQSRQERSGHSRTRNRSSLDGPRYRCRILVSACFVLFGWMYRGDIYKRASFNIN